MTFVYPAIFTPMEEGAGFHVRFPDLACCETQGPDLEDALDNASAALYNWIASELEEEDSFLPPQSDPDELSLGDGAFVRNIMVRIKLLPDND